MSTRIVASDAEDDDHEALRNRRRQLDPELAQHDEHDHGEAEQEDELADHSGVPADDRDRRPLARARVPAHERREHQHETRECGDALAHRPDSAGQEQQRVAPGLAAEQGGRAGRARKAPRAQYLQSERPLDLVPDDEAQVDARRDEREKHEPEAELRALRLAATVAVDAAAGSMQLIRALDSGRIELQRLRPPVPGGEPAGPCRRA